MSPSAFDEFTSARVAAAEGLTHAAVLAAIEEGRVAPGGPSEAAARGLTMPPGHWAQWSAEAADRIRRQAGRRVG